MDVICLGTNFKNIVRYLNMLSLFFNLKKMKFFVRIVMDKEFLDALDRMWVNTKS